MSPLGGRGSAPSGSASGEHGSSGRAEERAERRLALQVAAIMPTIQHPGGGSSSSGSGHLQQLGSGLYTIYSHGPLVDSSVGGGSESEGNASLSMANLANQLMQSSSQRRSPTPASLREEEEVDGGGGPGWLDPGGFRDDAHPPPATAALGSREGLSWPRKAVTPVRARPRSSSGSAAVGAAVDQQCDNLPLATNKVSVRAASSPQLSIDLQQLQPQQSIRESRFAKESYYGTAIHHHSGSMAAGSPAPASQAALVGSAVSPDASAAAAMVLPLPPAPLDSSAAAAAPSAAAIAAWSLSRRPAGSSSAVERLPLLPLPVASAVVTMTEAPKAVSGNLSFRNRALLTGISVSSLDLAAMGDPFPGESAQTPGLPPAPGLPVANGKATLQVAAAVNQPPDGVLPSVSAATEGSSLGLEAQPSSPPQQGGMCGLLACLSRSRPPSGTNALLPSTARSGDTRASAADPAGLGGHAAHAIIPAIGPVTLTGPTVAALGLVPAAPPEAPALDCQQLSLHPSTPTAAETLREACLTEGGTDAAMVAAVDGEIDGTKGHDSSMQPIAASSSPSTTTAAFQLQPLPVDRFPSGEADPIIGSVAVAAAEGGTVAGVGAAMGAAAAADAASRLLVVMAVNRPLTDPVRALNLRIGHSQRRPSDE